MVLLADFSDSQYLLLLFGLGDYIPLLQPLIVFLEFSVPFHEKGIAIECECDNENFNVNVFYFVNKIFFKIVKS